MRIGCLSSRTGVSRRLLRYYEEQGLLRPTRLANGYREYAESDADDVLRIRYLLSAGLPTSVIGEILPCVEGQRGSIQASSCPGTVTHLARERARVDSTIAALEESRLALSQLLDTLRTR